MHGAELKQEKGAEQRVEWREDFGLMQIKPLQGLFLLLSVKILTLICICPDTGVEIRPLQ